MTRIKEWLAGHLLALATRLGDRTVADRDTFHALWVDEQAALDAERERSGALQREARYWRDVAAGRSEMIRVYIGASTPEVRFHSSPRQFYGGLDETTQLTAQTRTVRLMQRFGLEIDAPTEAPAEAILTVAEMASRQMAQALEAHVFKTVSERARGAS